MALLAEEAYVPDQNRAFTIPWGPTMTQDTGVVVESFFRDVDFKAFRERTKMTPGEIIKALDLNYGLLNNMTITSRVPALVWKRACLLWGGHGVKAGPPQRSKGRRFLLAPSYADSEHPIAHRSVDVTANGAVINHDTAHTNGNGNGHIPPPAASPGPILFYPRAVAPATVSWEIYSSTMQMLLEQNAALLAEKLAVDHENIRLVRRCAFYENDADAVIPHNILDRIKPMRAPSQAIATALSIVATSVREKVTGLDALAHDLNARFPKTEGLRS